METRNDIVLVGAGNLATSLAMALKEHGMAPIAIWSRTEASASALASMVGCRWETSIDALPDADIVMIAVADSALRDVARRVAARYPGALLLHTAGSIPMDALREAGAARYGVFYPMQTMSRQNIVPFAGVSIFIEACDDDTASIIENIARSLSEKVVYATSEQRKALHVAAVFACNFPNALYNMTYELMQRNGLPFDAMLPLIDEAARKVHRMSPLEAQTGPARRGDINVMNAHKAMLDDELAGIYSMMSDYIMKRNK